MLRFKTPLTKVAQIFQKYRSHLKVLGARRVACRNFRTEDTQILGDTVKKFIRPSHLETRVCASLPLTIMWFYYCLLQPLTHVDRLCTSYHFLSGRELRRNKYGLCFWHASRLPNMKLGFQFQWTESSSQWRSWQSSFGNVTFFVASSCDKDRFEFPLNAVYASNTLTSTASTVGDEFLARNSPQCWALLFCSVLFCSRFEHVHLTVTST